MISKIYNFTPCLNTSLNQSENQQCLNMSKPSFCSNKFYPYPGCIKNFDSLYEIKIIKHLERLIRRGKVMLTNTEGRSCYTDTWKGILVNGEKRNIPKCGENGNEIAFKITNSTCNNPFNPFAGEQITLNHPLIANGCDITLNKCTGTHLLGESEELLGAYNKLIETSQNETYRKQKIDISALQQQWEQNHKIRGQKFNKFISNMAAEMLAKIGNP